MVQFGAGQMPRRFALGRGKANWLGKKENGLRDEGGVASAFSALALGQIVFFVWVILTEYKWVLC